MQPLDNPKKLIYFNKSKNKFNQIKEKQKNTKINQQKINPKL